MTCKRCGRIIEDKASFCAYCGYRVRGIDRSMQIGLVLLILALSFLIAMIILIFNSGDDTVQNDKSPNTISVQEEVIEYEKVDIGQMIKELENNALRAETLYQDKYIEFVGQIEGFDSDGSYITVEEINADSWNFDNIQCFIEDEKQREFLIQKKVGDRVTVRGQVTTIGEIMGYSVDIDEIY